MYELRRLLERYTQPEREGLSELLGIETSGIEAIIDSLTWHSKSLLGYYVTSEPTYRAVVCQIADKLGVSYGPHQSVKEIEIEIAKKVMKTVWEKMTPEQRRQMEKEWQKTAREFDTTGSLAGSASIFTALTAAQLSGFAVYLLATTSLGALTGDIGIILPFAAYIVMTGAIRVIIGPVAWIGAGLFALWALTGPNCKKLIPAILYICALRSQHESATSRSTGKEFFICSICGTDPGTNVAADKSYCNDCVPKSRLRVDVEDRQEAQTRWNCNEYELKPAEIKDGWEIQNPLLASINSEGVKYKILSGETSQSVGKAVFYLHGLGGTLDACPKDLEDNICSHEPLIRVACYGLSEGFGNIPHGAAATFGDICAILYNGRQSIYTIADKLELDSYSIVAHSWGGFIACITALNDTRCKKALLLCSTPDICDALCNMCDLIGLSSPWTYPTDIRSEADKAKFGRSWFQPVWDAISPYGKVNNLGIDMLIFNREEDPIMKKWNVEHFVDYSRNRGIGNIKVEFNRYPDLPDKHDMPPEKFVERMRQFMFEQASPNERCLQIR